MQGIDHECPNGNPCALDAGASATDVGLAVDMGM